MSMVGLANAITMKHRRTHAQDRNPPPRSHSPGWLLGYALTRLIVWLIREIAGVLALALLAPLLPVRRAVRFHPGEARPYA